MELVKRIRHGKGHIYVLPKENQMDFYGEIIALTLKECLLLGGLLYNKPTYEHQIKEFCRDKVRKLKRSSYFKKDYFKRDDTKDEVLFIFDLFTLPTLKEEIETIKNNYQRGGLGEN